MTKNNDLEAETDRLKAIARDGGLVLLYHGVWDVPPAELAQGLHNVSPDTVARQLEELKKHYTVVSVDEFAEADNKRGLAAVSFDDGYRCILDPGLAVFRAYDVPITIYLNGSTVTGGVFWRDKVRYLQTEGLVAEFEQYMSGIQAGGKFYRYTKHPDNNSLHVVAQIDRFLADHGLTDAVSNTLNHCIDFDTELQPDSLLAIGNHSHSHYVMSSLTPEQQYDEINKTKTLLETKPNIRRSELFSIPFGEPRDFNEATIDAARQCGYKGILLSRARPHLTDQTLFGMTAIERLMPRQTTTETGLLAAVK